VPLDVHSLRFRDLDPSTHLFDRARARAVVANIVLPAAGDLFPHRAAPHLDRNAVARAIDEVLVAAFGAWAIGWSWAASEPGGGGPVRSWCCVPHSMLHGDDPDAQVTVDRVVAAVADFRDYLEALSRTFADLHEVAADAPLAEAAELAAAQILPIVVERTSGEDAWYATFEAALRWYFESAGIEGDAVSDAVHDVISGRFESWIAPDDEAAAAACAEIGRRVAEAAEGTPPRDVLPVWCSLRQRAFAGLLPRPPRGVVRVDGHRRFIHGAEHYRDPERAERMSAALDVCRASAHRDEALTFEHLATWRAILLGKRVAFRTTDAFAKGGRERYGIAADTRDRFCAILAETEDASAPVLVRAARVYLDVCFFHPFDDGNARVARLALDHVLTRAGLWLLKAEPVFTVSRSATDARGARALVQVLEEMVGVAGDPEGLG
jgi:hypothetical protein